MVWNWLTKLILSFVFIVNINDKTYILADDIIKHAPIYSKGCRSSRDLIRKKEVPNYIYAKLFNDSEISNIILI